MTGARVACAMATAEEEENRRVLIGRINVEIYVVARENET